MKRVTEPGGRVDGDEYDGGGRYFGREGGSLDVSRLPEGTYYLNIEVNGTVVDRQVVLIQR